MLSKKLIVPIDRGNISRSPIAEAIIRKKLVELRLEDQYETISRGTQGVDPNDKEPVKFPNLTFYGQKYVDSEAWLQKNNIDLTSHISRPIDRRIAEKASVMLALDRRTLESLSEMFPDLRAKIYLLSTIIGKDSEIVDPELVNDRQRLEQIYNRIENIIVSGFPNLLILADGINKTSKEIVNPHRKEKRPGTER